MLSGGRGRESREKEGTRQGPHLLANTQNKINRKKSKDFNPNFKKEIKNKPHALMAGNALYNSGQKQHEVSNGQACTSPSVSAAHSACSRSPHTHAPFLGRRQEISAPPPPPNHPAGGGSSSAKGLEHGGEHAWSLQGKPPGNALQNRAGVEPGEASARAASGKSGCEPGLWAWIRSDPVIRPTVS